MLTYCAFDLVFEIEFSIYILLEKFNLTRKVKKGEWYDRESQVDTYHRRFMILTIKYTQSQTKNSSGW